MNPGVASFQASAYKVSTPVYEGPLDLLLQLIERAELDITRLALALVTDQYLEHLHRMQALVAEETNDIPWSAEEVSAFLVIAARLVQIKSEALLPRPPTRQPGEEDPGEALALQLMAYKRYRQIADLLSQREEAGLRTYLRLAPPPKVEGTVDLTGLGLADLAEAAQTIFALSSSKLPLSTMVAPPRVTIREKIHLLTQIFFRQKEITFQNLIKENHTRLDIVVTFLAILELVKRHFVQAKQESLFGDISLEPTENWNQEEDFELEFGE
jgi:segregation and condensation protein A